MINARKSRYAGVGTAIYVEPDGTKIAYFKRRIIPQSGDVPQLYQVDPDRAGLRLDLLAARLIGDSESFWRLLDANEGVNPFDFVEDTQNEPLRVPSAVPPLS